MTTIRTRAIGNSLRSRKARASGTRIVVRPKPQRKWLLAGTALVTGVVVSGFGASILTATPAAAGCSFVLPAVGDTYEVLCSLDVPSDTEYRGGAAPANAGDNRFDKNIHLQTDAGTNDNGTKFPTFFNSTFDGIDIDGTNDENTFDGYDITVTVNDRTAILAGKEGIQVKASDYQDNQDEVNPNPDFELGNITVTTWGFIQAGQDGIRTEAFDDGDTKVTNYGIIGVLFKDDLKIDSDGDGNYDFYIGDNKVELIEDGAFHIIENNNSNVGGHGINSLSLGDIWASNYGRIYANLDGIHADGGDIFIYNGGEDGNGLIDAQGNGIWAEGSLVEAKNGKLGEDGYFSDSSIYAGGQYGIFGGGVNSGKVELWNFGYVETWGNDADAVIYGRTNGDASFYVGVYNGGQADVDDEYGMNPNARLNGFDIDIIDGDPDTVDIDIKDANGIEVVKLFAGQRDYNHEGGKSIPLSDLEGYLTDVFGADEVQDILNENFGGAFPSTFNTFTFNYGSWDFNREDYYLSPSFDKDGNALPAQKGEESTLTSTTGGVYAPGGSAWLARNSNNASSGLWNYGTMIGQGSSGDPVLDIQTLHYEFGADSTVADPLDLGGDTNDVAVPNIVYLYNAGYLEHTVDVVVDYDKYYDPIYETVTYATYGVIGSRATPDNWGFDARYAIENRFGFNPIVAGFDWDFVESLIENNGDGELARFGRAADDQLVDASGLGGEGAAFIGFNRGLLIGQMDIDTDNSVGAFILNDGTWITRGTSRFFGSSDDMFLNTGLVQASQIGDRSSTTTLRSLNQTQNYGVFSLLDGGFDIDTEFDIDLDADVVEDVEGDRLRFDGNYYGGGIEQKEPIGDDDDGLYGIGFFALDAFLAGDGTGYGGNNIAAADFFDIWGDLGGSTGLIIRKDPRAEPYRGINQRGIDVVEYNDLDISGIFGPPSPTACGVEPGSSEDGLCRQGDVVHISPLSPDYIYLGDSGAIEDGLFAWYLVHDADHRDFELRSTWGPGAFNAPGLLTGAQNIFYETASVVSDHNYANQFNGEGGGGADLAPVSYDEAPASSGGTRSGLWVKGSGSWTERDTTLDDPNLGLLDTSFDQDIYSIVGGADMKPGGADSPVRIGVFGGYVASGLDFATGSPGSGVEYEGGVVGAYAAYNNGAFYVDGTVKGDLLSTTYSFFNVDVGADVTSIGVLANTGYRMTMGGAFLEPLASFAYVHTSADDVTDGNDTVDFSNANSLRAGAGARVGTIFGTGGGTVELSLLGKVWNEFEGDNTVTVTDGGGATATYTDDTSGVFGEVSGTVAVRNGAVSAFVTGGGEFGEDFTSYNARAGLRTDF